MGVFHALLSVPLAPGNPGPTVGARGGGGSIKEVPEHMALAVLVRQLSFIVTNLE